MYRDLTMPPQPEETSPSATAVASSHPEVQIERIALTSAELLGLPTSTEANLEGEFPVDLHSADLSGRDLRGLTLSGRDLSYANLREANLSEMNLEGVDLSHACLEGANLAGANLAGATLVDARCDGANQLGANLQGIQARRIQLRGAILTRSNMTCADLQRSDLSNSKLYATKVGGADFSRCDLRGSQMAGMTGYEKAEWKNVDIRDVDLHGTYLARRFIADQNYLHEFLSRGTWARISYYGWWLTSDCGRSLVRWGLLTCLLMVTFAKAFTMVEMDYGPYETWLSPIYTSVVTMTSLGFGDAVPASIPGQLVVMVEVTTGYVMLGGLLSIFSSRMARRAE